MGAVEMLTIPETAARLRVSPRSVYRLIAQRRIGTVPVGTGSTGRMRVPETELARFEARNARPAR